jgi:hypothetical protein
MGKVRGAVFVSCAAGMLFIFATCGGGDRAPFIQPESQPSDAAKDAASSDTAAATARDSGMDAADAAPAAAKTLHVLFVGNSYTSVNDLPGWVHKLSVASPQGPAIEVDSVTPGGVTFQAHWESTGAVARIDAGGFTHVVLQAQSIEPVGAPSTFELYGEKLAAEVKKSGATPVLYETWARQAGNAVYAEAWSGGAPAAMQEGLRDAYSNLAKESGALLAPVGDAWENVLAEHPGISLFSGDGSHPSAAGTYLAACVFYAVLTGQSPEGISARPTSLGQSDASILAKAAQSAARAK